MKKIKNFKILGGSLVLSVITYQSTYFFVSGATDYSKIFANLFPVLILGAMAVIAFFVIVQNLKKVKKRDN